MEGAAAVVELAATVVRYIDPLDAVIDRDHRVFRGGNALDDERYFELVLDQLYGAPLQSLLEVAAGGADAAGADITLCDITLAPTVMRGVNRQAECGVTARHCAVHAIVDEGVAAANVKLIQTQGVRRGLRGFLKAGLGYRAQHMGGAEAAGCARDACRGAGIEQFEGTDRRQHHRQTQLAAEQLDRGIDFGD